MADAVRTIVTLNTGKYYAVNLTSISDGTGENGVIKVDKSAIVASNGSEPIALDILSCWGVAFGCSHIKLEWDHSTDDLALALSGSFFFDYTHVGGLRDPRSAGGTGDILLTTSGMTANGGYTIDLMFGLREN